MVAARRPTRKTPSTIVATTIKGTSAVAPNSHASAMSQNGGENPQVGVGLVDCCLHELVAHILGGHIGAEVQRHQLMVWPAWF